MSSSLQHLEALHGLVQGSQPKGMKRHASEISGGHSARNIWTKPPTAIAIPVNEPPAHPKSVPNPYSRLYSNSSTSNPTAKQTIIGYNKDHMGSHISKKPRVDKESGPSKYFVSGGYRDTIGGNRSSGSGSGTGFLRGHDRTRGSIPFPAKKSKVNEPSVSASNAINLDDEEDVGEVVQRNGFQHTPEEKDELDVMTGPSSPEELGAKPQQISPPSTQRRRRSIAEDGKNTKKLRNAFGDKLKQGLSHQHTFSASLRNAHTDDDEIMEFTPSPENNIALSTISPIKKLLSPQKNTLFERKSVQAKRAMFESKTKEVPYIADLNILSSKERKGGLISRMKGKGDKTQSGDPPKDNFAAGPSKPTSRRDSVATSSTNFVQDDPILLPLEVCIWGKAVFEINPVVEVDPHHWLLYDDSTSELQLLKHPVNLKTRSNYVKAMKVDQLALHLQICQSIDNPFVRIGIENDNSKTVQADVSFIGLAFKFVSKHANLSNYERLVSGLKKRSRKSDKLIGANEVRSCLEGVRGLRLEFAPISRSRSTRDANATAVSSLTPTSKESMNSRTRNKDKKPSPRPAYGIFSSWLDSPVRRSSRLSAAHEPPMNPDEIILVYPNSGPGAVNISNNDLKRLAPSEFLNDTLIELGLKFWINDLREKSPVLADQIHVFSSFFYKKLNHKNFEEGYKSIRKWTSKVDIFKKKYIIVPINENIHWYLAIIYHPEHVLSPPAPMPPRRVSKRTASRQSSHSILEFNNDKPDRRPGSRATMRSEGDDTVADILVIHSRQPQSIIENQERARSVISDDDRSIVPMDSEVDEGEFREEMHFEAVPETESDVSVDYSWDGSDVYGSDIQSIIMEEDELRSSGASAVPPMEIMARPSADGDASMTDNTAKNNSNKFQSPAPAKNQVPADDRTDADSLHTDVEDGVEEAEDAFGQEESNPMTWIFTMDSLGARHPQAIRLLSQYLHMEAKDKKGFDNPSGTKGKQALVPFQPNHCDCGLYLLHFARTFISDPDRYKEVICSSKKTKIKDRDEVWLGRQVANLREEMKARILTESESWKRFKAEKESEKTVGEVATGASAVDSSEDEIEVGEVMKRSPISPAKAGRTTKGVAKSAIARSNAHALTTASLSNEGKASRMRG